MTVGYVIELEDAVGSLKYVGRKCTLKSRPHIFSAAGLVKNVLRGPWNLRPLKVLVVSGFEGGFESSCVTKYSKEEFLQTDFSSKKLPHDPAAVYKIQLLTAPTAPCLYVKANSKCRFGKVWNRSGDVRSHITGTWRYNKSKYAGAVVLEIVYEDDGITPKSVKHWDIEKFIQLSTSSRGKLK